MTGRGLRGRELARSIVVAVLAIDALVALLVIASPSCMCPMYKEPPILCRLAAGFGDCRDRHCAAPGRAHLDDPDLPGRSRGPSLLVAVHPRPVIEPSAEEIRDLERRRLRALVESDMVVARALHSPDYS